MDLREGNMMSTSPLSNDVPAAHGPHVTAWALFLTFSQITLSGFGGIVEFIPICGRNSRGSSTWLTRSYTSVGCGSTMSIAVSSAVAASKTEAAYGRWAAAIG
jgi:hypothetical protein